MSFVQGYLCQLCHKFIINNMPHNCQKSEVESVENCALQSTNKGQIQDNVSKEDISKLIEIMETCRPLWNYKLSISERSEVIKHNLWNQIFVHFNGKYSILSLQKSWKYLKEKYTREKKLAPSGSMGGKKEWPHLKTLAFLDDMLIINKKTTESLDINTSIEEVGPKKKKRD